jgi:pantetheine-phosphate adenylyltransferase
MNKVAVFPGSFDPLTRGHESVIRRALPLFDKIIIAVGDNADKKALFALNKRIGWLEEVFKSERKISIEKYSGLTVDFCRKMKADYILRGLRTASDFDFERIIGLMNKSLNPGVETIFLLSSPEYAAISSSIVREIHKNGGDVSQFVPSGISVR